MSDQEQLMWEDTDSVGMTAKCWYLPDTNEYKVEVSLGEIVYEEKFTTIHPPIFGMDVEDNAKVMEIAEILAQKIESA